MIYHIFANRSNIGDWLSAKGIQKLLSPLEITECLCDIPFLEETMDQLSRATEKDLVVIGGGGLFMDYFIPFWEAFKPVAERVPFCIWGVGYCDLKNEYSLPPGILIGEIVNKSRLCIVRDELTTAYLSGSKLPSPVPCPSINVIDPVLQKGKDLLHVVNYTTAGADTYDQMCDMAKTFCDQQSILYRETNNRINRDREAEMIQILDLYKKSGIILSSALHGCIIGVAMGLKVIAVSGDRKIEGFMEAVGLNEWVLDVNDLDQLPGLLDRIHLQMSPDSIVEISKEKNRGVAEKVISIYKSEGK